MREDLANQLLPTHGEAIDPVAMARRDQQKALPRRFYERAAAQQVEGGFAITLDGKPARTPGRNPITVPSQSLALALVDEWQGQGEFIDPSEMPLTRMANSAIDGVAREMELVRAEIIKYAGSDMLCYRAGDPQALVDEQAQMWDPLLSWAHEELGARFICAEGVIFASQPDAALEAVRKTVEAITSPFALAALHVMTTITGSVILALAVARGRLSPEGAWAAAHLDEDFQMRAWGEDAEALARRARRWRDMDAAARLYQLA
jgi:chaperone required for assembly of F1-ATPase